jgi:hypothetical protein
MDCRPDAAVYAHRKDIYSFHRDLRLMGLLHDPFRLKHLCPDLFLLQS